MNIIGEALAQVPLCPELHPAPAVNWNVVVVTAAVVLIAWARAWSERKKNSRPEPARPREG